jgi:hypothetical protein
MNSCLHRPGLPNALVEKKEPRLAPGLSSLNVVITVRHLLREEKQGMKALRRIIQSQL